MNLNPYGRVTPARLAQYEAALGLPLQTDYRQFLAQSNGGKFQAATVMIHALGKPLALDVLLGLDLEQELNLEHWNQQLQYEKPGGSLVIGTDPGGGFLLLGLEPTWPGVYYWDNGFWFDKSTPQHNIFHLARSFTALLALVK
jgi:hypothetical protein